MLSLFNYLIFNPKVYGTRNLDYIWTVIFKINLILAIEFLSNIKMLSTPKLPDKTRKLILIKKPTKNSTGKWSGKKDVRIIQSGAAHMQRWFKVIIIA